MKGKNLVIILLVVALVAGGIFFFMSNSKKNSAPTEEELQAALMQEKVSYPEKMEVANVTVDAASATVGTIKGELKNTGTYTVKEVELTIYFLDANGERIDQATYFPVISYGEDEATKKPLAGGEARAFSFTNDVIAEGWAQKVDFEVTRVEFE